MANLKAGSVSRAPYAGAQGNKSTWRGYHKFPVQATAGDTLELCEVPAGAVLTNASEAHSAFGATSTCDIGWKYKDGTAGGSATAFWSNIDNAAAGNNSKAFLPIKVDKPIIVYATLETVNPPADAELAVNIEGEFIGAY